jgi:hypothetical protein
LSDSGGLHLFVTPKGVKVWRLRFDFAGKEQTLVLGAYPDVGLADARAKRDSAKRRLSNGEDPRLAPSVAPALPTLAEVARRWHATNSPRWKPHHAAEVLGGLEREIFPALGATAITGRLSDVFAFGIGGGDLQEQPSRRHQGRHVTNAEGWSPACHSDTGSGTRRAVQSGGDTSLPSHTPGSEVPGTHCGSTW